jgi:hypothetical protein
MGDLCQFLTPPLHSGSLPQCPDSSPEGWAVYQIAGSWALCQMRAERGSLHLPEIYYTAGAGAFHLTLGPLIAYHHGHMEDHWVPHALAFGHVCGGLSLAKDGAHASPTPPRMNVMHCGHVPVSVADLALWQSTPVC